MRIADNRLASSLLDTIPKALRTALWLLSVMLPISFVVMILAYFGLIDWVSARIGPVFGIVGLSGKAPIVWVTAAVLNIYSAIAVLETLDLGIREITILALMCLIAHNLFVETTVQRKAGSRMITIVVLRLVAALASAFALNAVLPDDMGVDTVGTAGSQTEIESAVDPREPAGDETGRAGGRTEAAGMRGSSPSELIDDAPELLRSWFFSSLRSAAKIIAIVIGLLFLQKLLTELGIIGKLTRFFRPLLRAFGLPDRTHFLWIVANTLGLAYGAAVIVNETEQGNLNRREADLLNRHIAVSHSLLEDTLLFSAIGVNVLAIVLPRLILAVVVVWLTLVFRRLLSAGTALE